MPDRSRALLTPRSVFSRPKRKKTTHTHTAISTHANAAPTHTLCVPNVPSCIGLTRSPCVPCVPSVSPQTTILASRMVPSANVADPAYLYLEGCKIHEYYHSINGSQVTGESPFEIWLNEAGTLLERFLAFFGAFLPLLAFGSSPPLC